MKNIYIAILMLLMLLATCFAGFAQAADTEETTKIGKDIYFTLGYKMWYHSWQTVSGSQTASATNPLDGGKNHMTYTSDFIPASIFSTSLKASNFLIAGSIMTTPDYTFPVRTDMLASGATPTPAPLGQYTYRLSGSRKEYDVNLGYYLSPSIALTVGMKNIKQTYNSLRADGSIFYTGETDYNGPIVGITGGGSLGHNFAFYGNLSYGFLNGTYKSTNTKFDATFNSTELGIAYRPISYLSFLVGYKYQTIDNKEPNDSVYKDVGLDVTKGFILGANLTF